MKGSLSFHWFFQNFKIVKNKGNQISEKWQNPLGRFTVRHSPLIYWNSFRLNLIDNIPRDPVLFPADTITKQLGAKQGFSKA